MSMVLDPDLEKEIAAQAKRQGYEHPMDYLRDLIEQQQRPLSGLPRFDNVQELEARLLEGLSSGTARQISDVEWQEKERALIDRHGS